MPCIIALLNPSLHDANSVHEESPSYEKRLKPKNVPPIRSTLSVSVEVLFKCWGALRLRKRP